MLDWDDLRVFLAITRHRTLSAAAKHLHITQSTVGRRLASMQTNLGVRLLQRTGDGFRLTLAGEAILANAERVEAAALEVEQIAGGQDVRLEGTVRVATSQLIAGHVLGPGFAALHGRSASITIELLAHAPLDPVSRHQADISLQLLRFEHHDLVMRNLGPMQFGLYGSADYFERFGEPDLERGCAGHHVVALIDEVELPQHAEWLSECAGRAQIVLRSDSYEVQHRAVMSGGGLALLPRFRADGEPILRAVDTRIAQPSAEIWLAVHRENRNNPRVRLVLDVIANAVRAHAASLDPVAAHRVRQSSAEAGS